MKLTVDTSQAMQALQGIKPTAQFMAEIGANVAQPVIRYQKEHAPQDTGRTAESVTYEITNVSFTEITVDVGPTTPYAVYLEYGTGIYATSGQGRQSPWKYKNRLGQWVTTEGMRPQPFIAPSVEDRSVLSEVQRELDSTVSEFVLANWNKRSWKSKLSGLFKFGK
jgi:HK97 gp10 family phage protein